MCVYIDLLPDPDTGQSKIAGKGKTQTIWYKSREVKQDERGAEGLDLRGSRGESEKGKEEWAEKPRPQNGRETRAARGQSRESRRDVGRQREEATPRGRGRGGWGRGRHGQGAGWRETKVRNESGGRGDSKYDAENRNSQTSAGGAACTDRERSTQGPGLGYKKLEELSKQDPVMMAISLANHPSLENVLRMRMSKELTELLCLVLSNALRSRADRATRHHLANIVKNSDFFHVVLPYYLVGMESERNSLRRAQYPEHLENILAILSEVNTRCE